MSAPAGLRRADGLIHPTYQKLKYWLKNNGISYDKLGALLGHNKAVISRKINGQSDFRLKEVIKIFNCYGLTSEILESEEMRTMEPISMKDISSGTILEGNELDARRKQIRNEVMQILRKHNLTLGQAIFYLEDIKSDVEAIALGSSL